jgi:hypothetical protein
MKPAAWLALALLSGGITLLSANRILDYWSYNSYLNVKTGKMVAQMGDLYSPWVGTRELLLRHRNPYGPEVSHQIQMAFYGHAIDQTYGESGKPLVNEQRFAYPIYVVFLLAPTINADFADVLRWGRYALAVFTVLSVLCCFDILHWRLPWATAVALTLFIFCSPQLVQGLRYEQLALVVGFLLVAGAWCVQKNYLLAAGVLLAFSTVKPQMSLMPLSWFAIWAVGEWTKRWRIAAAFVATMIILAAGGELLLHGWIRYFIDGLSAYRKYSPTSSLLHILGDRFGAIVAAIVFLALLIFAWRKRKVPANFPEFTFVFAAFLMGTMLVFPLFIPFNQVMLILPAMLLLQDWKSLSRSSRLVFVAIVSWPWITDLALLVFSPHFHSPMEMPFLTSFIIEFFPPILLLLSMANRRAASAKLAPSDIPATSIS